MKFNIGDKVTVVDFEDFTGRSGVVESLYDTTIWEYECDVRFTNGDVMAFNFEELELIPQGIPVKIKRLSTDAVVPTYATPGSACVDLYATEDILIQPGECKAIPTGLAFEIPEGYQMKIHPRSGISLKTPLRIANAPGCVDSDFRGEVKVLLWNSVRESKLILTKCLSITNKEIDRQTFSTNTYSISKGDRIAQAEIVPVIRASFIESDTLGETERGTGGFGSTGVS